MYAKEKSNEINILLNDLGGLAIALVGCADPQNYPGIAAMSFLNGSETG